MSKFTISLEVDQWGTPNAPRARINISAHNKPLVRDLKGIILKAVQEKGYGLSDYEEWDDDSLKTQKNPIPGFETD